MLCTNASSFRGTFRIEGAFLCIIWSWQQNMSRQEILPAFLLWTGLRCRVCVSWSGYQASDPGPGQGNRYWKLTSGSEYGGVFLLSLSSLGCCKEDTYYYCINCINSLNVFHNPEAWFIKWQQNQQWQHVLSKNTGHGAYRWSNGFLNSPHLPLLPVCTFDSNHAPLCFGITKPQFSPVPFTLPWMPYLS